MSARLGAVGGVLVAIGALLLAAGAFVGGTASNGGATPGAPFGQPGGMMGGSYGPGMMGGSYGPGMMGGSAVQSAPGPGEPGFVAGTLSDPRVVRVIAGPGYSFTPSTISVAAGETVTFEVTSMGGLVHEFMVGPADAVAEHGEGLPEAADIGMMQTKSVTYTFDGTGPYAFACHEPGHYEGGMRGTIALIG